MGSFISFLSSQFDKKEKRKSADLLPFAFCLLPFDLRRTGVAKLASKFSLSLFAFCFLLLFLSACGKIGDPLPPIPRTPLIVNELDVTQQGSRLIVSIPLVRAPRMTPPQAVVIYRLIENAATSGGLTQETFASRASIIKELPLDKLAVGSTVLTYQDELDLNAQPKDARYRYAIRLLNTDGRAADFSNYALIEPLADLAAAPVELKSQLTQTELVISWMPSAANENGTTPANVFGYNLYRKAILKEDDALVKLNPQPLKTARYTDKAFAFGTQYEYIVRPLSAAPGKTTDLIEGNASEVLKIQPLDTFAPAKPFTPTIASTNAQMSLFWASNAEADLVGYNIYRAEDKAAPDAQWVKLNAKTHTPTTFRDERVQVGKVYFYRIAAVDNAGNESPRSDIVSETVNP